MEKSVAVLLLVIALFGLTSCSKSRRNTSQVEIAALESGLWDQDIMSSDQIAFYKNVQLRIDDVDAELQTATVTVTMPDLKNAFETDCSYEDCLKEFSITAPVRLQDGHWALFSKEPVDELIYENLNSIFCDLIIENGGLKIDFDAEEDVRP